MRKRKKREKRETKKNKICKRYEREKTERQSKIRTKKGENCDEKKKRRKNIKQKMVQTENNEKKKNSGGPRLARSHGTWSIACDLPHVLRGNLLVAVSNVHSCSPNLFEFVELTFSC